MFVQLVNSNQINAQRIILNYFEPGHTFMSADSFHHLVENELRKAKTVNDFSDFVNVVQKTHGNRTIVKEMKVNDFKNFKDHSSYARISKARPRPYLDKIVSAQFTRGSKKLEYKCDFQKEFDSCAFLSVGVEKNDFPNFVSKEKCSDLSKEQKDSIRSKIIPLLPLNRRSFWENLIK